MTTGARTWASDSTSGGFANARGFARSREGVNAALVAELDRGKLTVKVRANARRSNRVDYEWAWRCHIVIQCFGQN
jgi:hypothetical protein